MQIYKFIFPSQYTYYVKNTLNNFSTAPYWCDLPDEQLVKNIAAILNKICGMESPFRIYK